MSDKDDLCFPQHLNMSCKKPRLSGVTVLFLQFLLTLTSILTVVLNLLVIISVTHYRQLHRANNFRLLSLAVADFLIGLVFIPGEMLKLTTCWFFGDLMCLLYSYILVVIICASVGNIVLISVDRYVAICYPLQYRRRITISKVRVCISVCWFYSAFYSMFFVKDGLSQISASCYGECLIFIAYSAIVVDLFLTFLIPISVTTLMYIRVFLVVVFQARAIRSHTAAPQQGPVTAKKSELKAARTIGLIVLVFFMCFCPFYCASLAGDISFNTSITVLCIFCINSCFNPIIYAIFYPWFRKAIKQIVTLNILQPGSSKANIL
ncbi:trace amine-associated receptor 13c-like [Cyprinodon tularosa]|uniref:trace amine-associated receptor 13c-like n=1 Tax=Cyprinodon tularosa TaxID=77115 RepID=UPI0018E21FCD|nr:trace amine-associated receptor 13c-like [Cyprinodon tularosa]